MNKEGKYFSFIGASGSGKSTLLKYIDKNYDIETKEISARKFLDYNKGSYDKQINNELQIQINFYYLSETLKNILYAKEGNNIVTTRCVIDSLAYTYSLEKATFLIPQLEEVVDFVKRKIIILYTPCDFEMTQKEDTLRGMNNLIRTNTDSKYIKLMDTLDIPHYTISGSIEEREKKIDIIMKKYKINPK